MKYVALLRGINVGGKRTIEMNKLKEACEKAGLRNVRTYINSGNVLFESEKNPKELTTYIESFLVKTFFSIDTVILSLTGLKAVVHHTPKSWRTQDLRKYVAFLKSPATPNELIQQIQPKKNIDFLDKGPEVVYLSTKMDGLTKSSLPRLITKPIYKQMTMRNFTTVEKLLNLMQEM